MAVYRIWKDSLYLYEIPLYGSSRLGVIKENKLLKVKTAQNSIGVMSLPIPVNIAQSKNTPKPVVYTMGKKHYESTDWLGNVRVTYTDKKSWQQNKFALNVSSSQDYYPFGSVMEGRGYNLAAYRFGFVGHERDNEIKGLGNSYYFGSRIFDTQLGRWLSVDVLQARYPGYSLYHYGYCNPIIVLDPNGKENIVVVGNQGDNPSSDKLPWYKRIFENSEYRYGEYKRHFLEAGLNAAIELKRNNTDNHEETTLLVYNGNYTNKEISYYKKRAEKAGIKFKLVNSANDVKNYINESGGYIHGKKAPKGRTQDLITDFVYVGHGNNESLLLGHGHDEKDVLFGKDFKKESFSLDCDVWLLGCGNGLNIFDEFKQKVGGYVFGYTTTVVWGEKGIGSFAPFNMEYMRNGILRAIDYNRKELKPEERYRISKRKRANY